MSRSVRGFCPGFSPGTAKAGLKAQPLVPARLRTGTKGPPRGCPGTRRVHPLLSRLVIQPGTKGPPRGRRRPHAGAPPSLGFRVHPLLYSFFISFFISKKFSYICTLLRSCIYKITCLTIEHTNIYNFVCYMEITITGTRAPIFDYTAGDHQKRLFTLNSPASSIISFIKNPASSSVTPSRRSSGRSFSRMLSTYIRKEDQYEYINHDNKN